MYWPKHADWIGKYDSGRPWTVSVEEAGQSEARSPDSAVRLGVNLSITEPLTRHRPCPWRRAPDELSCPALLIAGMPPQQCQKQVDIISPQPLERTAFSACIPIPTSLGCSWMVQWLILCQLWLGYGACCFVKHRSRHCCESTYAWG